MKNGVITTRFLSKSETKMSQYRSSTRLANIPTQPDPDLEIHPEKVYTLLNIFVKYIGGCHRKRRSNKHDASANLKFMNWLLSDVPDYSNYEQEKSDRLLTKHKLRWLIPLLFRCKGDVNYVDNFGQSILFVFLAKYVTSLQLLKKEELHKEIDVVTKLLQEGASVNLIDVEGNTPLHIAVKQQADPSIIKMLLETFMEVDVCDNEGNTVLHILLKSRQDYTENIRILISKNANIDKPNKQGSTAVHLAVERCNVEALRLFNSNFSLIEKCGRKMLHLACDNLRVKSTDKAREATIDLLMSHGCEVDAEDRDGYTPLHYAAKHCSTKIVLKLLELGADKLRRTRKYGYTAMHMAAQLGKVDAMKVMLEVGVDVDVVARGGITPLHLALLYSEWSIGVETVRFLIENGADVRRRETIFGFTPLHMAMFANEMVVEFMAKRGVDVNAASGRGLTPLHLASILGNLEAVKILVDRGADVHRRDGILDSTALHWVSRKGEVMDVDGFVVDVDGYSARKAAMKEFWGTLFVRRHKSYYDLHELIYNYGDKVLKNANILADNLVLEMLLRSNAFVNVRDDNGNLPLYYVFKNSNAEGLHTLLEFGGNVNDVELAKVFEDKKVENEEIQREQEKEKSELLSKDMQNNKDDDAMKEKKKQDKVERDERKKKNEVLQGIVLRHVVKLKAANLPISSYFEMMTSEDGLQGFPNYNSMLMHFVASTEEVVKLGNSMVDGKISFYDLLHLDCNGRSKFIEKIATHNLKSKFPEYGNIIRNSCREAIERMHLLECTKSALVRIGRIHLPELCTDEIFSYLDNESLRTLVDVSCGFQ